MLSLGRLRLTSQDVKPCVPFMVTVLSSWRNTGGLTVLQNKYEAQRAVLKNGMVLSGSVMIGVQPLTRQHQSLFDGSRDEDPGMKVPETKIEPPQLPTGKVGVYHMTQRTMFMLLYCRNQVALVSTNVFGCRTCCCPCLERRDGPKLWSSYGARSNLLCLQYSSA